MKYTPGLMVGQLSGKAGSTVASRNKAGSYFRTKTTPKLVRNIYTESVRSSLASISSAFRALTPTQQLGWSTLGGSISRTDSLGNAYTLTGAQAHETINRNNFTTGESYTPDAPALTDPGAPSTVFLLVYAVAAGSTTIIAGATSATQQLTSTAGLAAGVQIRIGSGPTLAVVDSVTDSTHVVLSASVTTVTADPVVWDAGTSIQIDFTPNPIPTGTYMQIKLSGAKSAGINRPGQGIFRSIYVLGPGHASPLVEGGGYSSRMGNPPIGSKVFLQANYISSTGFSGQITSSDVIVQAAP